MQNVMSLLGRLLIVCGLACAAGCGRVPGSSTVIVPEIGLRLELPAGWRTERGNPRMMVDSRDPETRFGLIEDYPAEGKSLNAHVEEITRMDAAAIRSRQALTINGYPAIELISEAEFSLLEAFIQKGDRIIRVSFRVEKPAFPIQGPALRKSLQSIRFQ